MMTQPAVPSGVVPSIWRPAALGVVEPVGGEHDQDEDERRRQASEDATGRRRSVRSCHLGHESP